MVARSSSLLAPRTVTSGGAPAPRLGRLRPRSILVGYSCSWASHDSSKARGRPGGEDGVAAGMAPRGGRRPRSQQSKGSRVRRSVAADLVTADAPVRRVKGRVGDSGSAERHRGLAIRADDEARATGRPAKRVDDGLAEQRGPHEPVRVNRPQVRAAGRLSAEGRSRLRLEGALDRAPYARLRIVVDHGPGHGQDGPLEVSGLAPRTDRIVEAAGGRGCRK